MKFWRGAAALLIVFLVALPLSAGAQGGGGTGSPITDDQVNDISSRLYCPVCENIPLDVCGTAACARWRAQVRTLLEAGKSEDEVIAYFVEQFGQRVVGTPQDPALSFLSWAVPLWFVGVGAIVVVVVVIRWRKGSGRVAAPVPPDRMLGASDDDYRARLERELRGEE